MSKILRILSLLGVLSIFMLISMCIFVVICLISTSSISLDIDKLNSITTKMHILDSDGEKIAQTNNQGSRNIDLSALPAFVPQAFISTEDKTFYQHNGLNYPRIIKASLKNMISGSLKEGASTITQQLIKNTHLNSEKTLKRKVIEAILAIKLEKKYSKNEILNTYLNAIYFGANAYGIENASWKYFNHSATQLSIAESALLAGIIKSPKTYSPITNQNNSLSRRNFVLKEMLNQHAISKAEYNQAINTPIQLNLSSSQNDELYSLVIDEAMEKLNYSEKDISTMGLKIYTYFDSNMQKAIDKLILDEQIEHSFVIFDNKTNGIVALKGNIKANHQAGSTIKPLLCYAPAFEKGILSPASPILDEKTTFSEYSPHNVGDKYYGWVSARFALKNSLNIPAIKALNYAQIDYCIDFATKLGLKFTPNDNHLALALGASEYGQSLLDITNAYACFSRLGEYDSPHFIKRIESNTGKILFSGSPQFKQIFSDATAFLINDILQDAVDSGTAKKLSSLDMKLCAKTGTVGSSNNKTNTDAWCISYNPQFTLGVWCGNASQISEHNLSPTQNGGTIAATLSYLVWDKLNNESTFIQEYSPPSSVKLVNLDAISKQNQKLEQASENTPPMYIETDYFNKNYIPKTISDRFIIPPTTELKTTINEDSIEFYWEGLEYLNYELWYKNDRYSYKICSLTGKNKTLSYIFMQPSTTTEFWLIAKFNIDNSPESKSNSITWKAESSKKLNKKILHNWLKKSLEI
ncbi:MAG: transglycosylase domain-containing protein [Clostridia bacterium]|nr:transglycosylase domain-containing protein [Clostridia bacterium]